MMQRWVSIVLGAGVLVLAVMLAFFASPKHKTDATASVASPDTTSAVTLPVSLDGGLDLDTPIHAEVVQGTGPGFTMLNGGPVPPLPESAPRKVEFGVILIRYQGAELAPKDARPKQDALVLAQKLATDAKADFKGAVERGDNGSSADIGSIERGILEPAPEYVLFSLPVGGVSDVVDTPRGFWVVRRIE